MRYEKKKRHFGLLLLFIVVLFVTGLAISAVTSLTVYLLVRNGVLQVATDVVPDMGKLLGFNMLLSIPVCLLVSAAVGKFPLKPIRDLIDGMDRLAAGDFKARVKAGPVLRRYPAFVAVTDSFNKMADELESTETLRSDFINNFSHEFKTPIVSIAGFTKLLRHGNPTPEQQREYLTIIEEESMRLSYMATNVLNLTKVENQTILTDVSEFNLSEQIRSCILLLESKWSKKNLDLQLEFGEHQVQANEELLKQVWINLLDNAIKFTPDGHTVQVRVSENEESLMVAIMNTGSEISPEDQKKIFHKFYQADQSHATQGNGVGLAVVKRIVQLHGGEISVSSGNEVTVFTVKLPKE